MKEDIIRMAHDSGLHIATDVNWMPIIGFEYLERFAALVRADEREACAVIAETPVSGEQDDITMEAKDRVAAAIRARGQA